MLTGAERTYKCIRAPFTILSAALRGACTAIPTRSSFSRGTGPARRPRRAGGGPAPYRRAQSHVVDDVLRGAVDRLHRVLDHPGDELAARSGLALVTDRLAAHLGGEGPDADPVRDPRTAGALRDLLDAHLVEGLTLDAAAAVLHVTPTHLVKAFAAEFGLPPHRDLVGRRVDLARRLLLSGLPAARVAAEAGFHDQAHLTRHFRRLLGVTPGAYAGRRRP